MIEVYNNLLTRRSVRKYKSDMVEKELIDKVCQAGSWAATGMNRQSPIILAITNKQLRDRLSQLNCEVMGKEPVNDPFYGAPVVLVVLAKKSVATHIYDGSCVMQNLMNAATAVGLGSCWIHRAKEEFETEEGKKLLADLGIEEEYEGIGHCVIGYADEQPEPKPRKENWIYHID